VTQPLTFISVLFCTFTFLLSLLGQLLLIITIIFTFLEMCFVYELVSVSLLEYDCEKK